jgi:hypothetical protein
MSFVAKLTVASLAVGVGGLASLTQIRGMNEVPAIAALTTLFAAGPVSAGKGGPVDQSFTVRRVRLNDLVANVELITTPQAGPVRVQASGKPETMKEFHIRVVGDELVVRLDTDPEEAWFPWNLFNLWSRDRKVQDLRVRVTAPTGTPYDIDGMTGQLNAGDLDAPLYLEGHALQARVGRLQSAKVGIAGSGRINIGDVKEAIEIEVAGSGNISAASAKAADIEIAGGGNVVLGPLAGGLSAEVAGSGDIRAARVDGPFDVEIAGSGSVLVEGGQASSFEVEIAGSGDVMFKGHVTNPRVEIAGSGDVTVGSYSGNLSEEVAGSGRFKSMQGPVAPPPAQPAPPTPPAPPAPPATPKKF